MTPSDHAPHELASVAADRAVDEERERECEEEWRLEGVYDAEIAPLMERILEVCKAHRMPMIAAFAYERTSEGTEVCTSHIPPAGRSVADFDAARILIVDGFAALTVTSRVRHE